MAYEAGILFENLPKPKHQENSTLIWRHQPEWSLCFDNQTHKIYMSSTVSEDELDTLEALLRNTRYRVTEPIDLGHIHETVFDYQQAVQDVKSYIQAGDVFQANIARFWSSLLAKADLFTLYSKLRAVNPAPFSCYVEADDLTIVSASPERLFSISADGEVSARPIAGTRKRSEGEADDALEDELLLSEKERAEHIMLVDLERNDLGRVCEAGSIHVDECMVIEKYATVQHIVSNVRGKLARGFDLLDVLAAKFPGGTITGCPKVRCMEIIHELEPQARGPYTGGVGYMAWDGSVDMNILIRTFWHEDETLNWAAGAGIVADSVPEHEQVETEHKVAGLLRAFNHD
ncbi:MAG: anthranilate synthase component I family protein [Ghiorsea sp.]|nr:anthranilate synthase component I family protein [Ghiorsea sp.]